MTPEEREDVFFGELDEEIKDKLYSEFPGSYGPHDHIDESVPTQYPYVDEDTQCKCDLIADSS